MLLGESGVSEARKPEIMGDAAYAVLTKPSRELTGQFLIDDEVVRKEGISDLEPYSIVPGKLINTFIIESNIHLLFNVSISHCFFSFSYYSLPFYFYSLSLPHLSLFHR